MFLPLLLFFFSYTVLAVEHISSVSCGELTARIFAAIGQREALGHIAQAYQELWKSLAPDTSPDQFETLSKGDPFILPESMGAKHPVLQQSLKELQSLVQQTGIDPQEATKRIQHVLAQRGEQIKETENRIQEKDQLRPIEEPVKFPSTAADMQSNRNGTIFVAAYNHGLTDVMIEVHTRNGESKTYLLPKYARKELLNLAIANNGTLYILDAGNLFKTELLTPGNQLKTNPSFEKLLEIPAENAFMLWHRMSPFRLSPDEKLLLGRHQETISNGIKKESLKVISIPKRRVKELPQKGFPNSSYGNDGSLFGLAPITSEETPSVPGEGQKFQAFTINKEGIPRKSSMLLCEPFPTGFTPNFDVFETFKTSTSRQVRSILGRFVTRADKVKDIRPLLIGFDLREKKGTLIPWKGALEKPAPFANNNIGAFVVLGQLAEPDHVLIARSDDANDRSTLFLANIQTGHATKFKPEILEKWRKERGLNPDSLLDGTNRIVLRNRNAKEMLTVDLTPFLP